MQREGKIMKNKKCIFLILSVLFITNVKCTNDLEWSATSIYSLDKVIYVGNILFPHSLQKTPQMAIYRGGQKIKTETDDTSKKVQFTISEDKNYKTFYVLIAQDIQPKIQNNTVQFLSVAPTQNYKFYKIEHIKKSSDDANKKDTYTWDIVGGKVRKDGRIPDNTLIIVYNPDYIEKLEGGNELELPKIIIKQNILEIGGGTEEKLHDEEAALLMASLKLNIIHTPEKSEIKQFRDKKLIIAMAKP